MSDYNTATPPPLSGEEKMELLKGWLRVERNKRLLESDWTQLVDNGLGTDKKEEWTVYRQKLRDLVNTMNIELSWNWISLYNNTTWPTKPL